MSLFFFQTLVKNILILFFLYDFEIVIYFSNTLYVSAKSERRGNERNQWERERIL
jgi:hypothetical protein